MKGRKLLLPIFLLFLIFTSCKSEPDYDEDLLVGTVRVMDHNIPFPYLIEKNKDRFYLVDHQNNVIDSSGTAAIDLLSGNNIEMRDHNFLIMGSKKGPWIFDTRDSLNFHYKHPLYATQMVKAEVTDKVDLINFRQKLQKNSYQAEVASAHFATPNRDLQVTKSLKFSEDQLETVYTYYYQNEPVYTEKEVSEYHIFERKGKVFFSEGQDRENAVNLYQVIKVDPESFSLRSFRNTNELIETFRTSAAPEEASEISIFERCMEGQPGEYYHDNLTYSKGNEFLIRKISKDAPPASGDGYITVHFTINCHGQMGHLGLEQMDRDFQSTSFEPALVKHLVQEVMDLKDWPEIPDGQFYKDIHSFLMFRIKNGKITDLCP
jgi:hypothetical protein